jgi:sorbitol/mannitol transport system permease protein
LAWTALAWAVGLLIFFPIYWTILTSFKTEAQAINDPPLFFFFDWTLGELRRRPGTLRLYALPVELGDCCRRLDASGHHHRRSRCLVDGLCAVAGYQGHSALDALHQDAASRWVCLSDLTDLHRAGLLDTRIGLVVVLMLINLPIIVWMLYTYFKEIPGEILEAARMDGAGLKEEILYVLTPMAIPGIASTILLNFILAWNEAFWTLNLTAANAAPLTAFIASYSSPEGLFFAKLSAASTMAIAPILILGWFSQKQLVRGLTFGAVK